MSVINIIAVSHGTDSPSARAAINALRQQLKELLGARSGDYRVHEAYVDVQDPDIDSLAASLPHTEPCIIVPLLLSAGYHTRVDLHRAAQKSGIDRIAIAESLGPSTRLSAVQRIRLEQAGWEPGLSVMQGSAGSSRAEGRTATDRAAQLLGEELELGVPNGFIANISPTVATIAGESPAYASTYLLGEGFFAAAMRRKIHRVSPETKVSAPLLHPDDPWAAREIAQCALERMDGALATL